VKVGLQLEQEDGPDYAQPLVDASHVRDQRQERVKSTFDVRHVAIQEDVVARELVGLLVVIARNTRVLITTVEEAREGFFVIVVGKGQPDVRSVQKFVDPHFVVAPRRVILLKLVSKQDGFTLECLQRVLGVDSFIFD